MMKRATALLSLLLLCLLILPAASGAVVFGVVPAKDSAGSGVVVQRVAERTPAQNAGLQAGDVIVSVQGVPTPRAAELKEALRAYAPGDVLRVRYRRDDRLRTALVELAARAGGKAEPTPAVTSGLTPEVQLQFAQARSRLRMQLARLPHRADMKQVQADMLELLSLARRLPTGCDTWLQGDDVQMSLRFDYPTGFVELEYRNGALLLVVQEPVTGRSLRYPINTCAERSALPQQLLRRLQQF